MAITVISSPQNYTPVYNGVYFVLLSDNITQPGFQYVIRLTAFSVDAGVFKTTTHKINARPSDGYGIFNAMSVLESSLSNDTLEDIDNNFKRHVGHALAATIQVGESYFVAGVLTDFPLNVFPYLVAAYVFNGALDKLDFINFNSSNFMLENSTKRFLTNGPSSQKIKLNERAWLYSCNFTPANYGRRQVKTYNSAGTLVNTYNTTNILSGDPVPFDELKNIFLRTSAGPAQLSDFGVSFSNISYYTVQAQKTDGTAISELRTFVIDSDCSRYDNYRVHFLNKLGGFDSFSFNRASEEEQDIKRTNYITAESYTPATRDRMKKNSSVVSIKKLKINSNWLTEQESEWLEELVSSPILFIEQGDNLIAMNCTESKFKTQKKVNNKLFNLSISLEYTFKNNRQRY